MEREKTQSDVNYWTSTMSDTAATTSTQHSSVSATLSTSISLSPSPTTLSTIIRTESVSSTVPPKPVSSTSGHEPTPSPKLTSTPAHEATLPPIPTTSEISTPATSSVKIISDPRLDPPQTLSSTKVHVATAFSDPTTLTTFIQPPRATDFPFRAITYDDSPAATQSGLASTTSLDPFFKCR